MTKWTRAFKQDDNELKGTKVKASFSWCWDNFSIEIDEVFFKDNFHLIVTFRDGTVKDVDALLFINEEEIKHDFDEIRDNIDLFKHPICVSHSGIKWTDIADISVETLWEFGKTIKQLPIKKVAFAKIKTLSFGITLAVRSREEKHLNTPHFLLYKGNEDIGEIAVNGSNPTIDRCKRGYEKNFKQVRIYVDNNKDLLTQIYNAKDGNTKQELAKELP